MSKKTLFIVICSFAAFFVVMLVTLIAFKDIVSKYLAIVSSISAFLYLTFNSIVVMMNISQLNAQQKPYLVVAFETYEPRKGQFTFRNIGSVAAVIKSIQFDKKWLEEFFDSTPELTESEKKFLRELKSTHIVVAPESKIVLKPTIEPQRIIDGQFPNEVEIKLAFQNTYRQKFEKTILFDFSQYNEMIEYKSDVAPAFGSAEGPTVI